MPLVRLRRCTSPVALLLALGFGCRDGESTGPGLPGRAALEVVPAFETMPNGGPVIALSMVRARLTADTRSESKGATAEAKFEGDSAVLRFDVMVAAPSQLFSLEVEAIDTKGVVTFRGADTVRVTPGRSTTLGAPTLWYVAPDTAVVVLELEPIDILLEAGDSIGVSAHGHAADQREITSLNLGWLSRDPVTATVSAEGVVRARELERATWILARTFTGIVDSVKVHVRGAVSSVVITPDTAAMPVGGTVTMYAEARDAAGTPLWGSGREVTWSTLDPQIVELRPIADTVSSKLLRSPERRAPAETVPETVVSSDAGSTAVIGRTAGLARIVAGIGGLADTALVRVDSGSAATVRMDVSPEVDTLGQIAHTLQLRAGVGSPSSSRSPFALRLGRKPFPGVVE